VPPNDRIYRCQIQEFLNPSQPGAVFDAEGFGLSYWAGNVHVLPIKSVHAAASTSLNGQQSDTNQLSWQERGISMNQITDGTSTTILLGSAGANFRPWGHPANVRDPAIGINRSPEGFGGPPGWNGAMFLMCDGSVGFLSDATDLSVMEALATPAGGETVAENVAF
jgi:prepilin-type processing-associated H-X9-DG protein